MVRYDDMEPGIPLENGSGERPLGRQAREVRRARRTIFCANFYNFICSLIRLSIPLLIINAGLLTWLILYTKRITEPYNYPDWFLRDTWFGHGFGVFAALFFLVPLNAGFAYLLTFEMSKTTGIYYKPSGSRLACWYITSSVLFVIATGIWPVIGFSSTPNEVWYRTMKNSCDGFDMRVSLDGTEPSGSDFSEFIIPNNTLSLHAPGEKPVLPPLYIGSHIQYTNDPTEHFQYFFRVSGSTPKTEHITVDFDLDNHVWRMFSLNETDVTNTWSAQNSTNRKTTPVFHKQISIPTATPIKNGTWIPSKSVTDHSLVFPELELQIPHFYPFTQSCAFEPFLKIHRTTNLTTKEIQAQADAKWTKYNENTVLMRTANFGHSQEVTDVCIKHGDYEQDGKVYAGLGDDMLVPLGLLASYRLRMFTENLRMFCANRYHPFNAHQDVLT